MSTNRAQHYIPQFILRKFTLSGSGDESLWVSAPAEKKKWRSTPSGTGHQRDFYRIEIDGADPNLVENFLASVESEVAPIIRRIAESQRIPFEEHERVSLMHFLALWFVRVPSQREALERFTCALSKQVFKTALATPERWQEFVSARRREGLDVADDEVSYERMKEFFDRNAYGIELEGSTYQVQMMLRSAEFVKPLLASRRWGLMVSKAGEFICSDRPALYFESEEPVRHPPGLGYEDTDILVPVSRHVLLVGSHREIEEVCELNRKGVAASNRIALINTHRYVFSAKCEFPWMDREKKVRYDMPSMMVDDKPDVVQAYVKGSPDLEEVVEMRERPLRLLE